MNAKGGTHLNAKGGTHPTSSRVRIHSLSPPSASVPGTELRSYVSQPHNSVAPIQGSPGWA